MLDLLENDIFLEIDLNIVLVNARRHGLKNEINITRLCAVCLIGYDLAVDPRNFLPHLHRSLMTLAVADSAAKRLAILHLEGRDQKHAQKARQKLSVHFDFFSS